MTDTPASKMVRVRTPLIPHIQRLNDLHRQGYAQALLRGLEEFMDAIESGRGSSSTSDASELIADLLARLERLENQQATKTGENPDIPQDVGDLFASVGELTQRINRIESAIALLSKIIEPSKDELQSDSENDSEPLASEGVAIGDEPPDLEYPLSQRKLADRLGQPYSSSLQKARDKGKKYFAAWSQDLDPDGIAWTWKERGNRGRGKVSRGKALTFVPLP
jgi:hypothetical protein